MKALKTCVLVAVLLSAFAIVLAGCGSGGGGETTVSSAKAINAFSFANLGVTGTVNEATKTISVTVPYGTDVTALVATFTTTGASVKVGSTVQVSGTTPNDFTNPVVYTVTAADSSIAAYTATVTIAASSAKSITAFSFANLGVTGTVNEATKTISLTVPYGTDVTALVATFTTTGASVKVGSTVQVNGTTTNNFTNPVAYTVTAADGTSVMYTVTVTIAPSTAKAITAFSFATLGVAGTINESAKTISVTVPYGTDVTSLVATFTTTGASVKVGSTVQVSGTTTNNFTNPVSYTVAAADGTSVTYTVTVTIAPSAAKAITAFSFANLGVAGTVNESAKTISVTVPYGTDVTSLAATFTTTGASVKVGSTVQVSGTTTNDFTNPVVYIVTAVDSSTASYTVTVTIAAMYSISGTVTGPWSEGITMTLSGSGMGTTTTDASGNYSFMSLAAGSYTVTPSLAGYTYSPASSIVVITNANTTQNFTAASTIASYSISGTVSYGGSKTGRIYINVLPGTCPDCGAGSGTSIASTGTFTIRGLPPNNYVLSAWMDNMGTGARNASNPSGSSTPITIAGSDVGGVSITLADPGAATPTIPMGLTIYPANGSALIFWNETTDTNGRETATSYKIYWGTDANATNGGVITTGARDDAAYIQSVANGIYYYKISSLVGANESAASSVVGPVTIGALTGANTVSGTVTFPGTATGPMYVGVYSNTNGIYFTRIDSPLSPQAYSIEGVPNGSFSAFAVIDMNNNGIVNDAGDVSNMNGPGPTFNVNVSGNMTVNQTLSAVNAFAMVRTDHQVSGTTHSYNFEMEVEKGAKRPVAVTLVSGPNVAMPADAGKNPWGFSIFNYNNTQRPTVGDAYAFKVTFADGSSETVIGIVTGVLDSFAQNLAPTSTGSGVTIPTFTWADPASPPAYFEYQIKVSGSDANWFYPSGDPMPSTQHSVLYNVDGSASKPSLSTGTQYDWGIILRDANRNTATQMENYTP